MKKPEPGDVVRGKYRIDRTLGVGGMGLVVAAHHVALDQRVAIKFLLPEMLSNAEVVQRFQREARAAAKLQSDHVVRVMDVDTTEDGAPFMVMEFLEGRDLAYVREKAEPLSVSVAVDYAIEACEGVGEAHRVGIVHRDIKPANLFLCERPDGRRRIKVLDFGISKMAASEGDTSTTKTNAVMGSADYMSPEQMLASRDVDARSDIWALGATLYELLTARPPFEGESYAQVCALVMSRPPPAPSSLRSDIPPALEAVVLRCLEKERDKRYASAEELAAALAPFGSLGEKKSVAAVPVSGREEREVSPRAAASSGSSTAMGVASEASTRPARRTVWFALAAIALGAVAIGVTLSSGHDPQPAAAPSGPTSAPAALSSLRATSEPSASGPVVTPATAEPVPQASESASPAPTASASPRAIASTAPPARPAKPPASLAPTAKPRANCNPPFTIDSNGDKHAKPECL